MKKLFRFDNKNLSIFRFDNKKLSIFKFFNFDHNKMTIKDIRLLFGPSEFDRSIKNNHLKQELKMNEQAKVEFVEQDEYGFYIYKMTTSNGQEIHIVTTKKHDFE